MNKYSVLRSVTMRRRYNQEMDSIVRELETLVAKLSQIDDIAIIKQIRQMLENINRELLPAIGESEIANSYTKFDRDS